MTQINVELRRPSDTGTDVAASGYLRCVPTDRRHIVAGADYIVLPDAFTADLVDGKATLQLAPTSDDWAWEISERVEGGTTRTVSVPGSGPVDYGDLVDVDPTDFVPPVPAPSVAQVTKDARALRRFRVDLGGVADHPVNVLIGPSDSITDGAGASSVKRRWVSVFRDAIRRVAQPAGVVGGTGYVDFWNQSAYADYPVVSVNPVPNQAYGLGRQSLTLTTNNQTIVITDTMTDVDLIFRGGPGQGYLFYQVDSLGPAGIDASTLPAGDQIEHVTGLTAGTHTITIYGGLTPTPLIAEGALLMNGDKTKGVRVWEGGQSGFGASDYTSVTSWASAVANVQPSLVILPIGSNDYASGRSRAQVKADVLTIIGLIRANVSTPPSIVLVAYYDRAGSPVTTWADFVAMYHEIADADPDVTVFDLGPFFGPWDGTDRGGLTNPTDKVHPTDGGHKIIGEQLAAFVAP